MNKVIDHNAAWMDGRWTKADVSQGLPTVIRKLLKTEVLH